ncbi:hypothetical protein CBOM_07703 [Ceraceosorus bombacis]|uniref:Uncharacterized protein n=1 Tax=Ceraceosorus bombacis TaxID=401625 RepID=A0A0N7LA08_9BASI|nr:hypothetical protein CBOM_07703 [Ceraceosorus bombacis]
MQWQSARGTTLQPSKESKLPTVVFKCSSRLYLLARPPIFPFANPDRVPPPKLDWEQSNQLIHRPSTMVQLWSLDPQPCIL